MATQAAAAELHTSRGLNVVSAISADDYDNDSNEADPKTSTARAIVIALLISSPFWALVAFTIYLVL